MVYIVTGEQGLGFWPGVTFLEITLHYGPLPINIVSFLIYIITRGLGVKAPHI